MSHVAAAALSRLRRLTAVDDMRASNAPPPPLPPPLGCRTRMLAGVGAQLAFYVVRRRAAASGGGGDKWRRSRFLGCAHSLPLRRRQRRRRRRLSNDAARWRAYGARGCTSRTFFIIHDSRDNIFLQLAFSSTLRRISYTACSRRCQHFNCLSVCTRAQKFADRAKCSGIESAPSRFSSYLRRQATRRQLSTVKWVSKRRPTLLANERSAIADERFSASLKRFDKVRVDEKNYDKIKNMHVSILHYSNADLQHESMQCKKAAVNKRLLALRHG